MPPRCGENLFWSLISYNVDNFTLWSLGLLGAIVISKLGVAEICYAEIKHTDWMLQIT